MVFGARRAGGCRDVPVPAALTGDCVCVRDHVAYSMYVCVCVGGGPRVMNIQHLRVICDPKLDF